MANGWYLLVSSDVREIRNHKLADCVAIYNLDGLCTVSWSGMVRQSEVVCGSVWLGKRRGGLCIVVRFDVARRGRAWRGVTCIVAG